MAAPAVTGRAKAAKRIKLDNNGEQEKSPDPCIDHQTDINSVLNSLLTDDDLADIEFVVEGRVIKCHKIILGSRSFYFRAMLYGGLRETNMNRIELHDVDFDSFKLILKYIYTGLIYLKEIPEGSLYQLIGNASCYCLDQLTTSLVDMLINNLSPRIALEGYECGKFYQIPRLTEATLNYMDHHAGAILKAPQFMTLPIPYIQELLSRDTFYTSELKIFSALEKYLTENAISIKQGKELIKNTIRFELIPPNMLDFVRCSPYCSGDLAKSIVEKAGKINWKKVKHRGKLVPDTNFCLNIEGSKIIEGEPLFICDFASTIINKRRGESKCPNIVIKLGDKFFINHIEMLAYIEPCRENYCLPSKREFERQAVTNYLYDVRRLQTGHEIEFQYDIHVSTNGRNWKKVTDNTGCMFISWQCPYFKPRVVQYIKIEVSDVHTFSSKVIFHLLHLQALYSSRPMSFTSDRKKPKVIPYFNIAATPKIPETWPGTYPTFVWSLVKFKSKIDMYNFPSFHRLNQAQPGPDSILFTLPQESLVDTIKFLLYDSDNRTYDYTVEVGLKAHALTPIHDAKNEKSWQLITFEETLVRYIRFQGKAIYNEIQPDGFKMHCLSVYHSRQESESSENLAKGGNFFDDENYLQDTPKEKIKQEPAE